MQENTNVTGDDSDDRDPKKSSVADSLASLKQTICQLNSFKRKLLSHDVVLKADPTYSGQSWAGADAMVISDDLNTRKQFAHRDGEDAILCTSHAYAIGNLYIKLKKITAANYVAKLEMWGMATVAGDNAVQLNPSISQLDLAVAIVDEVIRVHHQWLTRASHSQ
jgi:putative NADH-flavin reductase